MVLIGVVAGKEGIPEGSRSSLLLIRKMKVLLWNVRGLGGSKRRACVRDLCRHWEVAKMSLQETKLDSFGGKVARDI